MADQYPDDKKSDYPPSDALNPPPGPPAYSSGTGQPPQSDRQPSPQPGPSDQVYPDRRPSPQPSQAYPPQPHHQPAGSRILHFRRDGILKKTMTIYDTDEKTPLYTIELHHTKPHVIVRSTCTSAVVGTVRFHHFTTSIELELHDQPAMLDYRGVFKSGYSYTSPAMHNSIVYWKRDGTLKFGDMVCLDEKEMPIARFEASHFSMRDRGRLELVGMGPAAQGGAAMDEIVVTGLALAEHRRRQNNRSSGGGAGGVGSG